MNKMLLLSFLSLFSLFFFLSFLFFLSHCYLFFWKKHPFYSKIFKNTLVFKVFNLLEFGDRFEWKSFIYNELFFVIFLSLKLFMNYLLASFLFFITNFKYPTISLNHSVQDRVKCSLLRNNHWKNRCVVIGFANRFKLKYYWVIF